MPYDLKNGARYRHASDPVLYAQLVLFAAGGPPPVPYLCYFQLLRELNLQPGLSQEVYLLRFTALQFCYVVPMRAPTPFKASPSFFTRLHSYLGIGGQGG